MLAMDAGIGPSGLDYDNPGSSSESNEIRTRPDGCLKRSNLRPQFSSLARGAGHARNGGRNRANRIRPRQSRLLVRIQRNPDGRLKRSNLRPPFFRSSPSACRLRSSGWLPANSALRKAMKATPTGITHPGSENDGKLPHENGSVCPPRDSEANLPKMLTPSDENTKIRQDRELLQSRATTKVRAHRSPNTLNDFQQ
jgi:hypothetical protein